MTFPSIDPKIVEKIIALDKAGHGRNQIDRELKEQGIKVSRGSITNVIKRYKARTQQSIQENTSSIHPSTTINSATPLSITGQQHSCTTMIKGLSVIAVTVLLASTRSRISAQQIIRPNRFAEPHGLYGVTVTSLTRTS